MKFYLVLQHEERQSIRIQHEYQESASKTSNFIFSLIRYDCFEWILCNYIYFLTRFIFLTRTSIQIMKKAELRFAHCLEKKIALKN